MGKYDKYSRIILPLNVVKTQLTSAVNKSQSIITTAGPGNEGIDIAIWVQEKINDGTIDLGGFVPAVSTNLSFSRDSNTITVISDTGTDAVLPTATSLVAGILTALDKTKLDALPILTGVPDASLDLGIFTDSVIPANSTIKEALQALGTAVDGIPTITFGDLTSSSLPISIVNGANSILGSGTDIEFYPSFVDLATLGGVLELTQLDRTGATTGDFIQFNGTDYVPATYTAPIPDHNDLTNIQGGTTGEYFHLSEDLYNLITNTTANTLIGRISTAGPIQELTLGGSIVFNSTTIQLQNDNVTPGNSMYYGTNGSGAKGWYSALFSGVTSLSATDSADIDFTVTDPTTTPNITGVLVNTGVTAGTYGTASSVGTFTVNAKGRITSATNTPISLTSSNISDLTEVVQDTLATTLVAGSNISIAYNDTLGTITIGTTSSYVGVANRIAWWSDPSTLTTDIDLGFDGQYLTVGNPSAGSISRITSKGTGTSLSTYGYVHQSSIGTEVFKVADNGAITVGALQEVYIHPDSINISTGGTFPIQVSGGDLFLYSDSTVIVEAGGTATNTPSFKSIATRSTNIGAMYNAQIMGTVNVATGGTNTYTDLLIDTHIDQGLHTGIIRSAHIKPVITTVNNYRALELDAPSTEHALYINSGKVRVDFPTNATGDIIYRNASGDWERLAVGTSMEVLGSNGTIPVWTTTAGSLPGGTNGDILVYSGGSWVSGTSLKEKISGITGTGFNLAVTPLADMQILIFRNGQYLDDTDDYSIVGTSVTMVMALVPSDKITAIYYI